MNAADVLRERMRQAGRRLLEMADQDPLPDPSAFLCGVVADDAFGDVPKLVDWLKVAVAAGVMTSADLDRWANTKTENN